VVPGLLRSIQSSENPGELDIEYAQIREINKLIDSYIIQILGEDISSSKFLEGLKVDK
jgi:hypothetical protein